MTKQEFLNGRSVEELTPCGTNGYGLVVYDIDYDIDDSIFWAYARDKKLHKSQVYYTPDDDRFYFRLPNGNRQFMDEILRV